MPQTHEPSPRGARADAFRVALLTRFAAASATGAKMLDLTSRDLHIDVGDYPGRNHAMPSCCATMRAAMRPGDEVLEQPPSGKGATLKIRYRLPR